MRMPNNGETGPLAEMPSLADAVRSGQDAVARLLECRAMQPSALPWDRDDVHILELKRYAMIGVAFVRETYSSHTEQAVAPISLTFIQRKPYYQAKLNTNFCTPGCLFLREMQKAPSTHQDIRPFSAQKERGCGQ